LACELPGAGLNGFGVSSWNLGVRLYVSGSNGVVYRLAAVDGQWEPVAKLDRSRFFHRLLPTSASNTSLLAIAGASDSGHLSDVEVVPVEGGKLD
jgi:hypothetical protein